MSAALGEINARFDLLPDPIAEARAIAPLLRDEAPKIEALAS